MKRQNDIGTSLSLSRTSLSARALWAAVGAAAFLAACEDEAPSIPRGGGEPPAAAPAAAPGDPANAADAGGTDTGAGAAVDAATAPGDVASDVAEAADVATDVGAAPDVPQAPPRTPRLSTASEMLGLGNTPSAGGATALPLFLRDRPEGAGAMLFEGQKVEPSAQYEAMAGTEPLPVSPLERQWGQATPESDEEARKRKLLQQSVGFDEPGGRIFSSDGQVARVPGEDDAAPGEPKKEGEQDATFELIMYKIGASGDVQTYERRFASDEARVAGERYARGLGFRPEKPTSDQIEAAKKALEAGKPKEKVAEPGAAKAPVEACPFRASWSEGGVQKSSCFPTQAALDAFTKARLAAEAAKNGGGGGTEAPKPAEGGGIQPVKLAP